MRSKSSLGAALALALMASTAQAQYPYPPPPPGDAAPAQFLAPQQLDQMLASVALYPDPLLTDVLTAATYPLEVVEAARWLQYPQNAQLYDGALAAALDGQGWDPSVKSLVPFPQVLRLMDEHLDWTQALGNAFLAQQADVMDSIQRLRQSAQAAGALVSTAQQSVIVDGPYIAIEPTSPQMVYIPVYSPFVVYGRWPYPSDPPIYYGPPPGFPVGLARTGIGFAAGIAVVDVLWHWGDWDWRDHRVHVDPNRFNRINAGRPPVAVTEWHHDPAHRGGAPYRDQASRARFEQTAPGAPDQRQRFDGTRGQASAPPSQSRPAALPAPTLQQSQPAPGAPDHRQHFEGTRDQASVPPQRNEAAPLQARPGAPPAPAPAIQQPPHPVATLPQAAQPAAVPHPERPSVAPPPPPQPAAVPQPQHPAPPAVAAVPPPQGARPPGAFAHGPDEQAHAQRGQESRQSAPQAAAPAAAPVAGAPHAAAPPKPPHAPPTPQTPPGSDDHHP